MCLIHIPIDGLANKYIIGWVPSIYLIIIRFNFLDFHILSHDIDRCRRTVFTLIKELEEIDLPVLG